MTFLIDENLSWRLVGKLEIAFPGCRHVTELGLQQSGDAEIWQYARATGYAILSKDDDMRGLVESHGPPPKLVWLRLGNATTGEIAGAILQNAALIQDFLSGVQGVLELS